MFRHTGVDEEWYTVTMEAIKKLNREKRDIVHSKDYKVAQAQPPRMAPWQVAVVVCARGAHIGLHLPREGRSHRLRAHARLLAGCGKSSIEKQSL